MKKGACHAERSEHLLFLVENKQKRIPRSARDDMVAAFFIRLLN